MQLITRNVPANHDIYLLGDIHRGIIAHNKKEYEAVIEKIKLQDNAFAIIMGDLIEARGLSHPYFDLDTADPKCCLPESQYEDIKETFKIIKDKIITIHEGNHDRGLSRVYGSKVRTICKDLEIPYGTFSAITTLRDEKSKKQFYKIYTTHGNGSLKSHAGSLIRRIANKKEALQRKLKNLAADCLVMAMGHTHGLLVAEPTRRLFMVSDERKLHQVYSKRSSRAVHIHEDDRWYVNTGSFEKRDVLGVTTYAESGMFEPVEMGYAVIHGRDGDVVDIEIIAV